MKQTSIPHPHSENSFIAFESNEGKRFLKYLVVPRPIAFITTKGDGGLINAAPFSYFNLVSTNPPLLSIAIQKREGTHKDTSKNIIERKEFVVNVCSSACAEAVTISGKDYPPHVSEIELSGLSCISSTDVSPPRISNTLAQMECLLSQVVPVEGGNVDLLIGKIIKIHVHKDLLDANGKINLEKLTPLARIGSDTYGNLSEYFKISKH